MKLRPRIALLFMLAFLLAGCAQEYTPEPNEPIVGDATPVMNTPAPTPEPELTPIEKAFVFAKAQVKELPREGDDPLAVYPYSSERLLTSDQLTEATPRDLEWAWREIAARRGIKEYRSYDFTDRPWYEPDPNFKKENLTQTEAANMIFLRNNAMEHYTNMKIVRNNRAQADLNGDGKAESFALTADRLSGSGTLQIGGTRYTIELAQIDNKIYLCDIDRSDKQLELAIPFTQPGGDYRLAFFTYDGSRLIMLGDLQGDRDTIRIYGNGIVNSYSLDTDLCAWRYPLPYRLSGGTLRPQAMSLRRMNIKTSLLNSIALVNEAEEPFTLDAGTQVWLLAVTPQNEYILYEPVGERLGTFTLDNGLIDGLPPGEIFLDLPALA